MELQVAAASNDTTQPEPLAVVKLAAAAVFTAAITAAQFRRIGSTTATGWPMPELHGTAASATDERATTARLRRELAKAVSRAMHDDFREGLPDEFADELRLLVADFGGGVFAELHAIIAAQTVNPNVGFRALTALARLELSAIAADRLHLFEWALTSPEPEIRYGAAFAIASARDQAALQPLQAAIERERVPELRNLFEKVYETLKDRGRLAPAL